MIDPDLALRIVKESPVIAFDTETDGLSVRSKVVGWVITNDTHSLYVPVRHEAGGNIAFIDEFEKELATAFDARNRSGYRTVGHHLGFDLRVSFRMGVNTIRGNLEDTMINESLIDDTTRGYSLDECAKRYEGVPFKRGDEMYKAIADKFGGIPDKKQMDKFWRMPGDHPTVIDYAAGDGVTTLALWEKQQPILDREELRGVWQLECDLIYYLARMHDRGIRIDHNYAQEVDTHIKLSIEEAQRVFPAGFNVRSSKEVENLYRSNGFSEGDFDRTEKGAASFTEKWLQTNEIGKQILGVRQLEKARDSFIKPLVETHDINGYVHPILHQSKSDEYGVAGARLSCSEPNLQAFPKRNKVVGKVVRPLVIPNPGMVLEEADFKQQEPRFFTHYSEDPALMHGYSTGTMDIHDRASAVLDMPRDYAKRLGLGMLTMMQPKTLAGHMNCSVAEAKVMHRKFLTEAFPAINKFQQLAIKTWQQRGYVKTLMGRRARFEGESWMAYRAVSRIIQNNGGDHMKLALLRANQYEDAHPNEINIMLSIHDSTIWQRDPGHPNTEIVRIIENVANEMGVIVPIPVDVGTGPNWSVASYGK